MVNRERVKVLFKIVVGLAILADLGLVLANLVAARSLTHYEKRWRQDIALVRRQDAAVRLGRPSRWSSGKKRTASIRAPSHLSLAWRIRSLGRRTCNTGRGPMGPGTPSGVSAST
jgi:hypothetical protein